MQRKGLRDWRIGCPEWPESIYESVKKLYVVIAFKLRSWMCHVLVAVVLDINQTICETSQTLRFVHFHHFALRQ